MKLLINFLKDIFTSKNTLWSLAKNDFKSRHLNSFFGVIWAFIQPLVTIFVFWFVFEIGFKNPPVDNIPFIIWFVPAYLAWIFFSETLVACTSSLKEYNYLVKKISFKVSLIPLVKIISSIFVHLFFVLCLFVLLYIYNMGFSIYLIQVIYYFICMILLLIGLGWLLSSVTLFLGDMQNIVSVFIQIGFWITPILWNKDSIEPGVLNILKLNPMYYIAEGYRNTFIEKIWFFEDMGMTIYFWIITIIIFILGTLVFRKLKPHFADVL